MSFAIPSQIRKKLEELVDSMAVVDGFNFDWNCVNPSLFDLNRIDSFPCCIIEREQEVSLEEFGGANGGLITNDLTFKISAFVDVQNNEIPVGLQKIDVIEDYCENAIQDLKRIIYKSPCLEGVAFNCLYQRSDFSYSTDLNFPAWVEFFFVVRYRQERKNPNIQR